MIVHFLISFDHCSGISIVNSKSPSVTLLSGIVIFVSLVPSAIAVKQIILELNKTETAKKPASILFTILIVLHPPEKHMNSYYRL